MTDKDGNAQEFTANASVGMDFGVGVKVRVDFTRTSGTLKVHLSGRPV
jgi:hypothetical protein